MKMRSGQGVLSNFLLFVAAFSLFVGSAQIIRYAADPTVAELRRIADAQSQIAKWEQEQAKQQTLIVEWLYSDDEDGEGRVRMDPFLSKRDGPNRR